MKIIKIENIKNNKEYKEKLIQSTFALLDKLIPEWNNNLIKK